MSNRIEKFHIFFVMRNAKQRAPTSSSTWNDAMAEIAHDLAQISSQWNERLLPLLATLPNGEVDVDAFTDGLDGKTLFVDSEAISGDYYNNEVSRPNTVKEELDSIYEAITAVQALADIDLAAITQSVLPDTDNVYDLGSASFRWRDLYVGPGSVKLNRDINSVDIGVNTNGKFEIIHNGNTIIEGDSNGVTFPAGGGGGVTDHGALLGLGDDDHTLYHNDSRASTWLGTKSTTDLSEGTNLYYTTARVDTWLGTKSTTNLAEGTNLYYTDARFDTRLGTKSTTDLAEGTNLYFTNERVDDRVAALLVPSSGIDIVYDDLGNLLTVSVTGVVGLIGAGTDSVQIGVDADAAADYSVAIGQGAYEAPSAIRSVVIGGATPYAGGVESTVVGAGASGNQNHNTNVGAWATSNGLDATAVGYQTTANKEGDTVFGAYSYVDFNTNGYSTSLGAGAGNWGDWSLAVGAGAQCENNYAIAAGWSAKTIGHGAIALGAVASGLVGYSIALGYGAFVNGSESIAIGKNATTSTYTNALAIGTGATVSANNTGAIGTLAQPIDLRVYGDTQVDVLVLTSGQTIGTNGALRYTGSDIEARLGGSWTSLTAGGNTSSTTAVETSVAASVTNVTLLSANSSRLGATLFNDSAADCYVKLGTTASSSSYTVKMAAQSFFEVPFNYTGRIDGIWTSATGAMYITELTA